LQNKFAAFGVSLIKMICGSIAFFSLIFTVFAVGPALETRYWPVVSKVEIISIEAGVGDTTIVRAAFRKLRDCEYVGTAWYEGTRPDNFERVSMTVLREPGDTSSPSRPVGQQKAGPWVIGMPLDSLLNKSFAQLTHRCHPFWMTTTNFFP